jgi:hypothetical protein
MREPLVLNGIERLGIIKQIVPIKITITIGNDSATQTLTNPVDPSNCILCATGFDIDLGHPEAGGVSPWFAFTSPTVITATCQANASANAIAYGILIEFAPGIIASVEDGIGTAALTTPVVFARSSIFPLGYETPDTQPLEGETFIELDTDGEGVTAAAGDRTHWRVVQWN